MALQHESFKRVTYKRLGNVTARSTVCCGPGGYHYWFTIGYMGGGQLDSATRTLYRSVEMTPAEQETILDEILARVSGEFAALVGDAHSMPRNSATGLHEVN